MLSHQFVQLWLQIHLACHTQECVGDKFDIQSQSVNVTMQLDQYQSLNCD